MASAPSVLMLDDGELDRFAVGLRRLGVDYVHLRSHQIGPVVERPTDLLITSLNRAVKLPELEAVGATPYEPLRICVHQQDFLPLRERLRKLGIHFLIHSLIDPETLRLLLLQLLHQGAEQRGARRVPFGCQLSFWADGDHHAALLAELSVEGCRLVTVDAMPDLTPVRVSLPAALSRNASIELQGQTLRCTPCELSQDVTGFNLAIEFDHSEAVDARASLREVLSGKFLGTRITPLTPIPEDAKPANSDFDADCNLAEDPSDDLPEISLDRRRDERRKYELEVAALTSMSLDAPQVVLGRDLSVSGLRIARHGGLQVGSHLALAIYGTEAAPPLVLEADVVNDQGDAGLGLRFTSVTPDSRRKLQAILDRLPELEALDDDTTQPERVFVSKVLPPNER